ncbi:toxic anion resistance protein [Anaerocolumna sp. AGMB13020]|uniref:toxic anion resistance protein n=1 Tax=Anaerocolumna sp. AGMB13020 TaxID=3081750 RepID=UPI002952DC72|nr:toxic anion resistance protein [Anaerocolumna sp. AGMB13020]WOO37624.1 toxic anion resistance protein [Anaerocolumna sp. AGMB13020]
MNGDTPTLTFDPFEEEVKEPSMLKLQEEKQQVQQFDESTLTVEEKKMVEDFASKIDLTKSNLVLQYGAGAQKKIADFSESALNNVKTKDLGEIGNMLSDVVMELKSFDADTEEKGILGFFKKSANKLNIMKAKYDKAEVNINKICKVLEAHQIQMLKDISMLDKMYELNKTYFKELSMYILAGKKKIVQVQEEELPKLVEKSNLSGLPEDAQAVNDLVAVINRFEKKIHDLELTRMISIQMAPQIRLVQGNDTLMTEKIQSTLVNTIPLWKSQMVLALGVAHSTQAAKAQREVTDMTNELLRKNAETLKMATIETAKESERGIVDIETLRITNQSLISTLDEVLRIQTEGRQKRKEAEVELNRIENELKNKLLSMRG